MNSKTEWQTFWDALNTYDRRLFRLLQRTHRELGTHVQMFYHGWMASKYEIEEFVKERFNVDLNNLPKDR
jgi:hypothetical protein